MCVCHLEINRLFRELYPFCAFFFQKNKGKLFVYVLSMSFCCCFGFIFNVDSRGKFLVIRLLAFRSYLNDRIVLTWEVLSSWFCFMPMTMISNKDIQFLYRSMIRRIRVIQTNFKSYHCFISPECFPISVWSYITL